ATLYTLTDRRVVMRIGIVLTITFNLPLRRIVAADLRPGPCGTADIALRLEPGGPGIAWLTLWPHARPWRIGRAEPMLRCLPQGEQVAARLTRAWAQHHGGLGVAAVSPTATTPQGAQPALASR
ncbi:MAG: PH domain-containing protein, partial [Rhodoferax sp.]|nr:PH domain-containing protein [Rhodoferax sp.]